MKQVVYSILSTIFMIVKPSKPFNPIIGETYEAFMCLNFEEARNSQADAEVYRIYAEQTSHHPPVSHLIIENEVLTVTANFELQGSTSGNSYIISNKGSCAFTFTDTNQKVEFKLPDVIMSGLLWGT